MVFDVNIYATHQDLVDELGGSERKLRQLLPPDADPSDPSKAVREGAARDTFKALGRRTPPITPGMVAVPSELRDAVVYGALARLYRGAITVDGDANSLLWRDYQRRFDGEVSGVRLSITGGPSTFPMSMPMIRR